MIQVQVRKSKISGLGLYALTAIPAGAVLFPSFEQSYGYLIELSPNNFINHSNMPNVLSVVKKGVIYKQASRQINPGEEITSNYFQTIAVIKSMGLDPRAAGIDMSFLSNPGAAQAAYDLHRKEYAIAKLPVGTILTLP